MNNDSLKKLLIEISDEFKERTNVKVNYVEYIAALLYLRFYKTSYFEVIKKEKKNFYIANIIDEQLKRLRNDLNNKYLFSNIYFEALNIKRNIGEESILTFIIDKLASLDETKIEMVAEAFTYLVEVWVKRNVLTKEHKVFYTPYYITELMVRLIGNDNKVVFDPWCGSCNFLVSACQNKEVTVVGYESDLETYNIGMTNLFLHEIDNRKIIYNGFTFDNNRYDIVVSNPPFSQKNWDDLLNDCDRRFIQRYGLQPTAFADYAYILYMLNHLNDKGKMAVIMPQGVLFRRNEKDVRRKLIEENYIEAIIELPVSLFYDNRISVVIMILSKNKANEEILFIDASENYLEQKNNNILTEDNIDNIVSAYNAKIDIKGFLMMVSKEKIRKNDYNLLLKRYIKKELNEIIKLEKQDILREIGNLEKEQSILEDNLNDVLESLGVSKIFINEKKSIKKSNVIDYKKIGDNIRSFRKAMEYTQSDLAKQVNISAEYLSLIENGNICPSLLVLDNISKALNVSIADIFKNF